MCSSEVVAVLSLLHYSTTPLRSINVSTYQWNEQFQRALEIADASMRFDCLKRLSHDFVEAAKKYGKIIISELMLHENLKTVKTVKIGGVAGGNKVGLE